MCVCKAGVTLWDIKLMIKLDYAAEIISLLTTIVHAVYNFNSSAVPARPNSN